MSLVGRILGVTASLVLGLFVFEILISYKGGSIVRYFPPFFVQLFVVFGLAVFGIIFAGRGVIRRVAIGATIAASIAVAVTFLGFYNYPKNFPVTVCSYLYRHLEAEGAAPSVGIPDTATSSDVEVSIEWPGEVACKWSASSAGYEGASYSVPMFEVIEYFGTWFS